MSAPRMDPLRGPATKPDAAAWAFDYWRHQPGYTSPQTLATAQRAALAVMEVYDVRAAYRRFHGTAMPVPVGRGS